MWLLFVRVFVGDSMSAIQSNKHSSCATNAHGQGDRHADVSGVSSVESEKQIQHFFTDASSAVFEEAAGNCCVAACCSGESGLLRKSV